MFEYDHTLLSIDALHRIGIRGTRELEEVIEGYSFADEEFFDELGYSVIRFIGFTNASRAVKVACRLEEDGRLTTLDARIPSIEEIVSDFCKYC